MNRRLSLPFFRCLRVAKLLLDTKHPRIRCSWVLIFHWCWMSILFQDGNHQRTVSCSYNFCLKLVIVWFLKNFWIIFHKCINHQGRKDKLRQKMWANAVTERYQVDKIYLRRKRLFCATFNQLTVKLFSLLFCCMQYRVSFFYQLASTCDSISCEMWDKYDFKCMNSIYTPWTIIQLRFY